MRQAKDIVLKSFDQKSKSVNPKALTLASQAANAGLVEAQGFAGKLLVSVQNTAMQAEGCAFLHKAHADHV